MSLPSPLFNQALEGALKCSEVPKDGKGPNSVDNRITSADVINLARDVGTMLHSHCTKLSLAARPPKTADAINACINDIQKLFPIIGSLCLSLQNDSHGKALCDKIRNQSRYALIGVRSMVEAVSEDPVSESRLSKTGILWESCLELQNLQTMHILMSLKVKESTQMIGDAIDDLKSWSLGEEDDNFTGFEDSGSESDTDETDASESGDRTNDAEINRRISMLTRIQLFLKAVDKRQITPSASTQLMNDIYDNLSALSVEVDDLAGEIQESSDTAFIMEMEKIVIQRVEELLSITLSKNTDDKWQTWVSNFRQKWLEEVPRDSKSSVTRYSSPPSYQEFFDKHLQPLKPCLIEGLLTSWPSRRDWCQMVDSSLLPNYEYLRQNYGNLSVSVTVTEQSTVTEMPFSDFLNGMEAGKRDYARDIHIMKHFPQSDIYSCPSLFRDDWLNFKLDAQGNDDYKFVYIGGDGTRTGLHKDVVASHSWSSNLTGTKEWTLIPPDEAFHLFTFDHEEVVSDINLDDALTRARWPNLQKVRDAALIVLQHPGETIFVPSTWYHQVRNIGPTLSINHNWINAVSLLAIFENLVVEVTMSADAVSDLRDDGIVDDAGFVQVVQDLTLANAGMNWDTFFDLILFRFEHEDSFIPPDLRPSRQYEHNVVLDVCQKWRDLEDAQHLPSVAQKVTSIRELLERC